VSGGVTLADTGASGTDKLIAQGTAGADLIVKAGNTVSIGSPVTGFVVHAGVDRVQVRAGTGKDEVTDPGADTEIYGEEGDDTIVITASSGAGLFVDGGDGSDAVVIRASGLAGPVGVADSITQSGDQVIVNGVVVTVGTGVDALTIDGGGADQFVVVGTPTLVATVAGVGDLVVTETAGNDAIVFNSGSAAGEVARLNGAVVGRGRYPSRLVAHGLGGDDDLQVAGSISVPAWLYSGAGDDRLKGGDGHDPLVGGDGRDILIGGAGADRIVGNADEDIVVAGSTAYDEPITAGRSYLSAVAAVWTGPLRYAARVAELRDGLLRADGSASEVRVSDEGSEDVVTGSAGPTGSWSGWSPRRGWSGIRSPTWPRRSSPTTWTSSPAPAGDDRSRRPRRVRGAGPRVEASHPQPGAGSAREHGRLRRRAAGDRGTHPGGLGRDRLSSGGRWPGG
jgi:Ca2+-binding RTX toxin-like protein